MKKLFSLFLALSLTCTGVQARELIKGEYADLLLKAAEDYSPGLTVGDFFKGDGNGDTSDNPIKRVEALAMLRRAFGELPELTGDLLRTAPDAGQYGDIPFWAEEDIAQLAIAGVLEEGDTLGSNEPVDEEYVDTILARMYRLFGTDPRDDYYAYVNKVALADSVIEAGTGQASAIRDLDNEIGNELVDVFADIIREEHEPGTPEQMLKDFYLVAADAESRNALGNEPIRPYLEQLRSATTDEELAEISLQLAQDTTVDLLAGFSPVVDYEDQTTYLPVLETYGITLSRGEYEDEDRVNRLNAILSNFFVLAGYTPAEAGKKAELVVAFEKELVKHTSDESGDPADIYNYYTLEELQGWFKTLDLKAIADVHGFTIGDRVVVTDPEACAFYASYFDGEHTDTLKALAEVSLVAGFSTMLDETHMTVNNRFSDLIYGYNPHDTIEYDAFVTTMGFMDSYIGQIYCENNMTEEKEAMVRDMVDRIKAVYKERISNQEWMSPETKAEAIEKLDSMELVIGLKETDIDPTDNIEIKGIHEGGTYTDNIYAVLKENDRIIADLLAGEISGDNWYFSAYMVNATYSLMDNTFMLPAGLLNAPYFDTQASPSQNYGALGFAIGHEMSHAFDTSGAQFDNTGAYRDWWTEGDHKAYDVLTQDIAEYYDGAEVATGIGTDGAGTLDENIADLAGVRVALDALKTVEEEPDYKGFFESFASVQWASAPRSVLESNAIWDSHAAANVRVNYALKCLDEFYDAYNVQEGDGMYLPEEERVGIW